MRSDFKFVEAKCATSLRRTQGLAFEDASSGRSRAALRKHRHRHKKTLVLNMVSSLVAPYCFEKSPRSTNGFRVTSSDQWLDII